MFVSKKEFLKMSIHQRLSALKKDAIHIGARVQGAHTVHLYSFHGYYVEVWVVISLHQIHWIEIQNNDSIIKSYAENVEINKDLGLD